MPKARKKEKHTVPEPRNAGSNDAIGADKPILRHKRPQHVDKPFKVNPTSGHPCATTSTRGQYTPKDNTWKFKKQNRQSSKCQRGRVHDKHRHHQKRNSSVNVRYSNQRFNCRKSNTNRPSTADSESSSTSSCDIPGFYLDPEKKKYFKILPGQNNVNVITRESIAEKLAEQKRLKDLENKLNIPNSKSNTKFGLSSFNNKLNTCNFLHITLGKHLGDCSNNFIESFILKSHVEKLKLSKFIKVFRNPFGTYENLEHMLLMDTGPDCCDILGLWSIKGNFVNRIQLLHVDVQKKQFSGEQRGAGLRLDVNPCGNVVLQSLNKITNVCWAPSVENPTRKYILYTTMCYTGHSPSLALFRNLEPTTSEDFQSTDFCLGNKATWTCAWNPHKHRFSVGLEKHGIVLDVESRKLWEMFSNNSDVLAQVFTSTDQGNCLLSGTRKGEILTHDLRSCSTYPVKTLHQRSPISSLKLLKDEVYLLASDFAGKIKLWDLRMRKVVQDYKGHSNQYSKLPIHVDESENLLYIAGEDCYTRFWDLKTEALITSLPPPCPASRDYIPSAVYSQHWGGQWGQAGLILGMKDKLYFYDNSQECT